MIISWKRLPKERLKDQLAQGSVGEAVESFPEGGFY
jgi:hypothetical protein